MYTAHVGFAPVVDNTSTHKAASCYFVSTVPANGPAVKLSTHTRDPSQQLCDSGEVSMLHIARNHKQFGKDLVPPVLNANIQLFSVRSDETGERGVLVVGKDGTTVYGWVKVKNNASIMQHLGAGRNVEGYISRVNRSGWTKQGWEGWNLDADVKWWVV